MQINSVKFCQMSNVPSINGAKKLELLANRYSEICTVRIVPEEEKTRLVHFWTYSYLPLDLRLFSFQLFNNSLPVGARMGIGQPL